MILVGFAGMLIGLLVGVRSVVFALIPTMIGAIVVAGLTALIGDGDSVGVIAIKMALFLTCLQFGYLGGAAFPTVAQSRHAIQPRPQPISGSDGSRAVMAPRPKAQSWGLYGHRR
jgi:hypothetical protein